MKVWNKDLRIQLEISVRKKSYSVVLGVASSCFSFYHTYLLFLCWLILCTNLKNTEKVITKLQVAFCTWHHSHVSSTKCFHVLQLPYLLKTLMEENILLEKSWTVWEFLCWTSWGSREPFAILPSPGDPFHPSDVRAHGYLNKSKQKKCRMNSKIRWSPRCLQILEFYFFSGVLAFSSKRFVFWENTFVPAPQPLPVILLNPKSSLNRQQCQIW